MNDQLKSLLSGSYELALANCTFRQRGTTDPIEYSGPGILDQDINGTLRIRSFADTVETIEAFTREFPSYHPGQLFAETEYYDLEIKDIQGRTWKAQRVMISADFGATTHIQCNPWRIDCIEDFGSSSATKGAQAFLPGTLDLPWHKRTDYANGGFSLDQFELDAQPLSWNIKKEDDGVEVTLRTTQDELEETFTKFLWGLSILTGRRMQPPIITYFESGKRTTRIFNVRKDAASGKLTPPIRPFFPNVQGAHTFLEGFLYRSRGTHPATYDHARLIYQLWYRLLRSRESDIENSSLVISVAIEGFIKEAFLTEGDADETFSLLAQESKPKIEQANFHPRIRGAILSSLGNASKPRAIDGMRRLVDQGAVTQAHVDAWKELRNTGAHGGVLDDDEAALQTHLDRFHTCLDFFYRLVFVTIGYRGPSVNYSIKGWSETTFPVTNTI